METPGGPATAPSPQSQTATRHERANIMGGAVLIVLGLLFLLGNLFPDFNFLHRLVRERDANRIADAFGQQRADANG